MTKPLKRVDAEEGNEHYWLMKKKHLNWVMSYALLCTEISLQVESGISVIEKKHSEKLK